MVARLQSGNDRGSIEHRASAGILPRPHEPAECDAARAAEAVLPHPGLLRAALAHHGSWPTRCAVRGLPLFIAEMEVWSG